MFTPMDLVFCVPSFHSTRLDFFVGSPGDVVTGGQGAKSARPVVMHACTCKNMHSCPCMRSVTSAAGADVQAVHVGSGHRGTERANLAAVFCGGSPAPHLLLPVPEGGGRFRCLTLLPDTQEPTLLWALCPWTYHPFQPASQPVPVCDSVFVYELHACVRAVRAWVRLTAQRPRALASHCH